MKLLLSTILLTISLTCNINNCAPANAGGDASDSQLTPTGNDKAGGARTTLDEQGLSFILPTGWRKDESAEADDGELAWRGLGKTKLSITVSIHKPEYGGRSIEEETERFYRVHKEGGSEDARLLEIGGVRGVHFLVDGESWEVASGSPRRDFYRFIRWSAQRMYKGERQILSVILSAPVSSFSSQRDTLYGILNSIEFIQK